LLDQHTESIFITIPLIPLTENSCVFHRNRKGADFHKPLSGSPQAAKPHREQLRPFIGHTLAQWFLQFCSIRFEVVIRERLSNSPNVCYPLLDNKCKDKHYFIQLAHFFEKIQKKRILAPK
jgi:hypothetical protein